MHAVFMFYEKRKIVKRSNIYIYIITSVAMFEDAFVSLELMYRSFAVNHQDKWNLENFLELDTIFAQSR